MVLSSLPGQDASSHHDDAVGMCGRVAVHECILTSLSVTCSTPRCVRLGQIQLPSEHGALSPHHVRAAPLCWGEGGSRHCCLRQGGGSRL